MPGLRAFKSDANMVLVRLSSRSGVVANVADSVFGRMKARGVLVKNVSGMHPLLANCLRLTVGTADENRAMLVALKESL